MAFCTRAFIIAGALSLLSCGAAIRPMEPLTTAFLELQVDDHINNGQSLTIDVIYITYVQELREVTRLGPDEWFRGGHRSQWKFKESVKVNGGEQQIVALDPLVLDRTVMLVIYANYENILNPAAKQVIIDFAGLEREVIEVQSTGLHPKNKSLQYVK